MALKPTLTSFQDFYSLKDPLASRPLRLERHMESRSLSVEHAFALAKGQEEGRQPVKLNAYMGGQASDFLWSGFPPLLCVSSRVVDLLTENNVSGWSTYLVEVYDRKGVQLPNYHGFAVTGPECERDRSRSEIVAKPPPAPGGRGYDVYRGLYFDEEGWDGSDFFWIRHSGIVITQRVYMLLRKAKVRNISMIPLPEVEIPVSLDQYGTS